MSLHFPFPIPHSLMGGEVTNDVIFLVCLNAPATPRTWRLHSLCGARQHQNRGIIYELVIYTIMYLSVQVTVAMSTTHSCSTHLVRRVQ